jgi:hypothetical protein
MGSVSFLAAGGDVLLARDRWRLVEAVSGARSVDDLTERFRALISE